VTHEQMAQAIQDRFGYIVITGESGYKSGHVIPAGKTGCDYGREIFWASLVIDGVATQEEMDEQCAYVDSLNDPHIGWNNFMPPGHDCYYKAKAE